MTFCPVFFCFIMGCWGGGRKNYPYSGLEFSRLGKISCFI